MHRIPLKAISTSQVLILITFSWSVAGNSVMAQTSDPAEEHVDRARYDRGSNEEAEDVHAQSGYDPNDYDDFYYDPDYSPGYDTGYFPRDYSVLGSDYSAYGVEFGPTRFGGGRTLNRHAGGESPGRSESAYGFENFSHQGNAIGNDYFTDDWYDDNSEFDNWY